VFSPMALKADKDESLFRFFCNFFLSPARLQQHGQL
jgi:hypothetical protein